MEYLGSLMIQLMLLDSFKLQTAIELMDEKREEGGRRMRTRMRQQASWRGVTVAMTLCFAQLS